MSQSLPDTISPMTYAAFRAGFVTVVDQLVCETLETTASSGRLKGLFHGYPLLEGVAPQIQLELLMRTWDRCRRGLPEPADVLDECVLDGIFECLSRIAAEDHGMRLQVVLHGPCPVSLRADQWLSSQARVLQVVGHQSHSSGFYRQLEDLDRPSNAVPPEGEPADDAQDRLLELVGRWSADGEVILKSELLLTEDEQSLLRAFFAEHPGLLRS